VLLIKEAFVLVALKSTAKGKMAYIPARTVSLAKSEVFYRVLAFISSSFLFQTI
jgi:hypothetical protein